MRRKTIKKNFWFSYDEDKQLKYLSSILNLSESNTIRKLLYETQIKESPPKEFYDAIDKINKIGVNINQLTRLANSHIINVVDLKDVKSELKNIWQFLSALK